MAHQFFTFGHLTRVHSMSSWPCGTRTTSNSSWTCAPFRGLGTIRRTIRRILRKPSLKRVARATGQARAQAVHNSVHHFANIDRGLVAAGDLAGKFDGATYVHIVVGQIARIAQLAAVVTLRFCVVHIAVTLTNQATTLESDSICSHLR